MSLFTQSGSLLYRLALSLFLKVCSAARVVQPGTVLEVSAGRNDEKGEIQCKHCHLLCDFGSDGGRRTFC